MRREQRHHLKENPIAVLVWKIQQAFSGGRKIVIGVVSVTLFILVLAGGYLAWEERQVEKAGEQLAKAMAIMQAPVVAPPLELEVDTAEDTSKEGDLEVDAASPEPVVQPQGSFSSEVERLEAVATALLAAANAYPTLRPGITARYQAATVMTALGQNDAANTQYKSVIELGGETIYSQMARLGLAEGYLLGGDYAEAVTVLESEVVASAQKVPIDAILIRLGRAYRLSKENEKAFTAYVRIVKEFPLSPYFSDAKREEEILRSKGYGEGTSSR